MKQIKLGPGFAIFLLFFGMALLEAFQTKNWARVFFWIFIGLVFILFENLGKPGERNQH